MRDAKYYYIKQTGDVLQYLGETLTDPHKGEYSSEFKVVIPRRWRKDSVVCDFELYDRKTYDHYELVALKGNDINSIDVKSLEVLYGR